jgi:hypothetical protein
MKHSGRTIININSKDYVVKFGMGALMHFSEPNGGDVNITLVQLQKGGIEQMKAIAKFIYSALYVSAMYKDEVLDLELSEIVEWLDSSSVQQLQEISEVISAGLTSIAEVKKPIIKKSLESKKK